MAVLKCKMCGGDLNITADEKIAECEFCGTTQTVPTSKDENLQGLFNRANILRMKSEFDKAEQLYEKIIEKDDTQAEAYWGLILCKYGIEYVEDPVTYKRIPTCHRTSYDSIIADEDYKSALNFADSVQCGIYEAEAKEIDRIQKSILELSQKEEPYDVFICYKETDNDGKRTQDSVIANDIYYQLTREGLKVFYAAITLENKLGSAYEPCIFAALNSAKVMLAIGTKPEYFNAVWVKNEWSRFLKIIQKDRSKLLIPCYRDMDAYELPEEFAHLQAQDMSKIGFINDVVRGIKKVVAPEEPKQTVVKETVTVGANSNTAPLLERVFMFLEDGDWNSANEYCEKVLDIEPKCAEAYLGKLMAELHVKKQDALKNIEKPFNDNNNYQKAIRYADAGLKSTLQGYISTINERNEHTRLESVYKEAKNIMNSADDEFAYIEAAEKFKEISHYLNAAELSSKCTELAGVAHNEAIYQSACKEEAKETIDMSSKVSALERAISKFEQIPEYKDSTDKISKLKLDIEELNKKIAIKRKKIKKITIIVTSATVILIAFLLILFNFIIPAVKYSMADKYIESKEYANAVAIYEELGDYKDCADKLISSRYLLASSQLENKEYKNAYDNFSLIKDYEDSKSKRQESSYGYAQELMNNKKYQEAVDVFNIIGNYEDSAQLKNQCYLEGAKQLYANKEYYNAITWYEKVTSYDKNAEFYKDSCYNYGVQQNNSGNYTSAVTYLEKAGDYKSAKELIKTAKYKYVTTHKNRDDMTTFEYLKDLKTVGHMNSAEIYKELYAWKVTVTAVNSDSEDETTNKTSISKYDPVYFHFKLTGGEPNGEIYVKNVTNHPNGNTTNLTSSWKMYDGATNWFGWSDGIYTNPAYGSGGKMRMKFYDPSGNLIGEGSVNITS